MRRWWWVFTITIAEAQDVDAAARAAADAWARRSRERVRNHSVLGDHELSSWFLSFPPGAGFSGLRVVDGARAPVALCVPPKCGSVAAHTALPGGKLEWLGDGPGGWRNRGADPRDRPEATHAAVEAFLLGRGRVVAIVRDPVERVLSSLGAFNVEMVCPSCRTAALRGDRDRQRLHYATHELPRQQAQTGDRDGFSRAFDREHEATSPPTRSGRRCPATSSARGSTSTSARSGASAASRCRARSAAPRSCATAARRTWRACRTSCRAPTPRSGRRGAGAPAATSRPSRPAPGGGTRRPDGNGRRAQVEYLSPAHLAETDAHAQRTRDRLAAFDPALVAAIGAAVAQDLAFFAGVFEVV